MSRLRSRPRCLLALAGLLSSIGCAPVASRSAATERGDDGSTAALVAALDAGARLEPSARAEHCANHEPTAAGAPLPGRSLYHLQARLIDQRGAELGLDAFRGQPVLIAMFYSSCTSICPMLIGQLQRIESALAPELRAQTRVLLVSLDPERDSVARLAALARQHAIESSNWHFTRTSESSVREIAALLGVRYRRTPDGEISHSPLVALLDRDGLLVVRQEGAQADLNEIATSLTRMLESSDAAHALPPR